MAGKIDFPDIYVFLCQTLARGNRQTMFDESFHQRIFMILHITEQNWHLHYYSTNLISL